MNAQVKGYLITLSPPLSTLQPRAGVGGVQDVGQHPGSEPGRVPADVRGAAAAAARTLRTRDEPETAPAGQPP